MSKVKDKTWEIELTSDCTCTDEDGVGMGWQSKSGSAEVEFDKALKSLTINGDFRITAKWEGKTFTASRASHDEPTGSAKFKFTLIKERG